jgi:hypothetical protein
MSQLYLSSLFPFSHTLDISSLFQIKNLTLTFVEFLVYEALPDSEGIKARWNCTKNKV